MDKEKFVHINGGENLNIEQKMWLLNPKIMEHWKENDMNIKEMCLDFNKQFPEAPELTYGIIRKFYKKNGV